jgi:hypothetical protein
MQPNDKYRPTRPEFLKPMKAMMRPAAWRVSMFGGEVFGGRCDYCNTALSADALSQDIFQKHRGHIPAISAWMRIARPQGYRGLELKLPVELFAGRHHPYVDKHLHLPAIVFKCSCKLCQIQQFPHSEKEVLSFCSQHSSHLRTTRLHAIVQNFGGRAVLQTFSLFRPKDSRSSSIPEALAPSAPALSRAGQLRDLCMTFACFITGMRCEVCHATYLFPTHSRLEDELHEHEYHPTFVHLQVKINEPAEYADLELEVPAHLFSLRSLLSDDGLRINCVLVELSRQHGGPSITPWNAAEIGSYIQAQQGRNQPKFCALIRGEDGQVFQCEVPVIHGSLPAGSADQVRFETLVLHPGMEGP